MINPMRNPGAGGLLRKKRAWKTKDGKIKTSEYWSFWFVDVDGKQKQRKGYTDKKATQEALKHTLDNIGRKLEGLPVPEESQLRLPITEHLEKYKTAKRADGITMKQLSLIESRLKRFFTKTGVTLYREVTESAVQKFLLDEIDERNMSKKTRNDYRASLKQFTGWVAQTYKCPDLLIFLKREKGQDDVRLKRMALTAEQLSRLVHAAQNRGIENYLKVHPQADHRMQEQILREGIERGMIYLVGALIGLRRNEICTLTWGCLNLNGEIPTCTIEAKNAKSRRCDTVPISKDIAMALRWWKAQCTQEQGKETSTADMVFHVPRHLSEQFYKDCAYAKIATRNDKGDVLDFYAATRHTFCTLLGRMNISPHIQRQLMRHMDMMTTLKYTHLELADLAVGVKELPAPMPIIGEIYAHTMLTKGCLGAQNKATGGKDEREGE